MPITAATSEIVKRCCSSLVSSTIASTQTFNLFKFKQVIAGVQLVYGREDEEGKKQFWFISAAGTCQVGCGGKKLVVRTANDADERTREEGRSQVFPWSWDRRSYWQEWSRLSTASWDSRSVSTVVLLLGYSTDITCCFCSYKERVGGSDCVYCVGTEIKNSMCLQFMLLLVLLFTVGVIFLWRICS